MLKSEEKAKIMHGDCLLFPLFCLILQKVINNDTMWSNGLTKGEMQVMNILWSMGRAASISDLLEQYDEPKPAYTTVLTFARILMHKGFVESRKGPGKAHLYSPLISKAQYSRMMADELKDNCFDGSVVSMVDFFMSNETLSESEVEELLAMIQKYAEHHE